MKLKSIFFMCVASALSACVPQQIVTNLPVSNESYAGFTNNSPSTINQPLLKFEIAYPKAEDGKPETKFNILLNGFEVSKHFDFAEGMATANTEDLLEYLYQGKNVIQPNPPSGAITDFSFDSQGPTMALENKVNLGEQWQLSGTLEDASDIQSLSINGYSAALTGRDFELTIPKASRYTVNTQDVHGFTETSNYVSSDQDFPILSMRIGDQVINDLALPVINASPAASIDMHISPVIFADLRADSYYNSLAQCNVRPAGDAWMIDPENTSFDGLNVKKLTMTSQGLYLEADIKNLVINSQTHIRNCSDGWLSGSCENSGCEAYWSKHSDAQTNLGFKTASIAGYIEFEIDNGSIDLKLNDDLDLTLDGGFASGGDLSSDALIALLNFANGVGLESLVSDLMKGTTARIINQQLADLSLLTDIPFELPSGQDINVKINPKAVMPINRALFINFAGSVSAAERAAGVKPFLGVLEEANANFPVFDGSTPAESNALDSILNMTYVNQVLFGLYEAGMTHFTATSKEFVFGPSASLTSLSSNEKLKLDVILDKPARVQLKRFENNQANLQLHDLTICVSKKDANNNWNNSCELKTAIDVDIPVDITLDSAGNAVVLSISQAPNINISQFGFQQFSVSDTLMLNFAKNLLVNIVMERIDEFTYSIELPTIGDVRIETEQLDMSTGHLYFKQRYTTP